MNGGWGISYKIALRWMSLDLADEKSTLVQVMAWCRQATSHYPSQCWPRSMLLNGITRPQWVKLTNSHNTLLPSWWAMECLIMWHHQMTFMENGITNQGSVCSTVCSDWQQRNMKGLSYYPLVRGIHQWPVFSCTKDSNMKNVSIWWRHNVLWAFAEANNIL